MLEKIKLFTIKRKIKTFVKGLLNSTSKQIVFVGLLPNTIVFCYYLISMIRNFQLEIDFIFLDSIDSLRIKDKNYKNKKIIICDILIKNQNKLIKIIDFFKKNNLFDCEFLFLFNNEKQNSFLVDNQFQNFKINFLFTKYFEQVFGFGIGSKNNYCDFNKINVKSIETKKQ